MISIKEKKVDNCERVYKKYLGDDYDFSDQKYSLIISNHIGLFDVILVMYLYQPGFIAKKLISNYPFFGSVARGLNCLFVDRENENAQKKNNGRYIYETKKLYGWKISFTISYIS